MENSRDAKASYSLGILDGVRNFVSPCTHNITSHQSLMHTDLLAVTNLTKLEPSERT